MAFDLDRAMLDGGKCIVIKHPHERFKGRIICKNKIGYDSIVVLYREHETECDESIVCTDWKGMTIDRNMNLINAPAVVDVWVILYFHKSNGKIAHSCKQSETEARGTITDLNNLGHTVIASKKVTMTEGEYIGPNFG